MNAPRTLTDVRFARPDHQAHEPRFRAETAHVSSLTRQAHTSPPQVTRHPAVRSRLHRPTLIDERTLHDVSLTRISGGTYSATVGTARFADGTSSRTDLIRLNPTIDAYSVDRHGRAPHGRSHYRLAAWSSVESRARDYEREIVGILLNSYPTVDVSTLSARLRAAGVAIGRSDIAEHHAIAATQAAIWHFSDGADLDASALDQPVHVRATMGAAVPTRFPARLLTDGIAWHGSVTPEVPAYIELVFPGAPRLGSYTLTVHGADAMADLRFSLQSSVDGFSWNDVSSSAIRTDRHGRRTADGLTFRKGLGLGATITASRHGGASGHTRYRLVIQTGRAQRVNLGQLRFGLEGAAPYANHQHVVALYRYLIGTATRPAPGHTAYRGRILFGSRLPRGMPEFTSLAVVTH